MGENLKNEIANNWIEQMEKMHLNENALKDTDGLCKKLVPERGKWDKEQKQGTPKKATIIDTTKNQAKVFGVYKKRKENGKTKWTNIKNDIPKKELLSEDEANAISHAHLTAQQGKCKGGYKA